jgi:hypothetical protein
VRLTRRKLFIAVFTAAFTWIAVGVGDTAAAHAFGDSFSPPLPLWLYIMGAALTVIVSFLVIGSYGDTMPGLHGYRRLNLLRSPATRLLVHPVFTTLVKLGAVGTFGVAIAAGFVDEQLPPVNFSSVMVWIVWWTGMAFISALVGDVWRLFNPLRAIFDWTESLSGRVTGKRRLTLDRAYPEALGAWPAFTLFAAFAWLELIFPDSPDPSTTSTLLITYAVITWAGMFVFGKERWLASGDAFSVVFGLFARLSPTERAMAGRDEHSTPHVLENPDLEQGGSSLHIADPASQLNLRPLSAGLLTARSPHLSVMAIVLLVLATVTFDGLSATREWIDAIGAMESIINNNVALETAGLVLFVLAFIGLYLAFSYLIRIVGSLEQSPTFVARTFVLTLLPIAIAYHLSHYLWYLLVQGQLVIPLLSDPLGLGWNLFGTANYIVNADVIEPGFGWTVSVALIVLGHIAAVYSSHAVALHIVDDEAQARRSQYPMLILMVGYTVASLWILGQPAAR